MSQVLKNEVKKKIQNSAVEVFTRKGYKKASIKEIASNADVSVGNVYRYFKNKDDLYESVVRDFYNGINELMDRIISYESTEVSYNSDTFIESVYAPMTMFIDLYHKEKKVFTMFLKEEKDKYYEKTIESFIDILKNYFYGLWGADQHLDGLSYIETSALTNALVFSVVDILNQADEDELEKELIDFVTLLTKGFFVAKNNLEEKK